MKVRTIAVFMVVMLVAGLGVSFGGPLCRMVVSHPELDGDLGITVEQREQLEDLYENTEKEIIEARSKLDIKHLEMERVMRSAEPDMREIRKLVTDIGDARSTSMLARIERDLKVKQILTPDQVEKAGKLMMRMGGARGHRAARNGERKFGMSRMGMGGPRGRAMRGTEGSGMHGQGCKGHMMKGTEGSGMHGQGCKGHMMKGTEDSGMHGQGCKGHMMKGTEGSGMHGQGCKGHMMKGSEEPEAVPGGSEAE
jgi:Spy/CpxP family protein refolding chaperone